MGLLENLLGGGQNQQDLQGFVNRYEQGSPGTATRIRRS